MSPWERAFVAAMMGGYNVSGPRAVRPAGSRDQHRMEALMSWNRSTLPAIETP